MSEIARISCDLNPPGARTRYLEALNTCFPGWGDERQYAWCFDREVGAPAADLMVLRDGEAWIAGSAVTYRRVRLANGNSVLAGIMTGSWTLPAARGRGCFTRIIEESVALVRGRHGAVLLAFVTHDNSSCRRLMAAGAGTFAASYIFSEPGPQPSPAAMRLLAVAEQPGHLEAQVPLEVRRTNAQGHSCVAYAPTEWRSQMLERPAPTELLKLGDAGWAVVETKGAFARLQATALFPGADPAAVLGSLWAFVHARGQQLFLFSMDPAVAAAATAVGLTVKPGYLTALAADGGTLSAAVGAGNAWAEPDSTKLADPASGWHLGPWFLESGDRM